MARTADLIELPGGDLDAAKMPGHWLLARLGKRVLRPGGLDLTRQLLEALSIAENDRVVELAPGLGVTARLILERNPLDYVGIERDVAAVDWTIRHLPRRTGVSVKQGQAHATGLPAARASVVVGEAMLSMNTPERKREIVAEAFRLLRRGGRYGIHELCVIPEDIPAERKREIEAALSSVIHVGARPLTAGDWSGLLGAAGFRVARVGHAPMHILRPRRMVADEGLFRALRIAGNMILDGEARRRMLAMRRMFERYRDNLDAIFVVAEKIRG